jgi:hypothetical protein
VAEPLTLLSIYRLEDVNLLLLGDDGGEMAVACQVPWAGWRDLCAVFCGKVTLCPGRTLNYFQGPPDGFLARMRTGALEQSEPLDVEMRTLALRVPAVAIGGRQATFSPVAWAPGLGWVVNS